MLFAYGYNQPCRTQSLKVTEYFFMLSVMRLSSWLIRWVKWKLSRRSAKIFRQQSQDFQIDRCPTTTQRDQSRDVCFKERSLVESAQCLIRVGVHTRDSNFATNVSGAAV